MKSVCIIGAGPGGLVTAKTLLHSYPNRFKVTIFEQSDIVGGIWAFQKNVPPEQEGRGSGVGPTYGNAYINANTPTNLSRYTVSFSDLAWHSVDLDKKGGSSSSSSGSKGGSGSAKVPLFPKAWQAGAYLREYTKRYIPEGTIAFGRRVVASRRVSRQQPEDPSKAEPNSFQWEVDVVSSGGRRETRSFDCMVNAAGFFSGPRKFEPRPPDGLSRPQAVIHSSKFRTVESFFQDLEGSNKERKVLVVGGANSGGEAAATAAFQVSSLQTSPGDAGDDRFAGVKVHHILPRPLYNLPLFVPSLSDPRVFTPLDLRLYDLSAKPPGPIESNAGPLSLEVCKMVHGFFNGMLGDQSELGAPALTMGPEESDGAPPAAITETYAGFVRSGDLIPTLGRLEKLVIDSEDDECMAATVLKPDGSRENLSKIAGVIYATGYAASSAFAVLPEGVRAMLSCDPRCDRLPIVLDQYQTGHPSIPELAFVGFYPGPFWGMMEMQARIIAERWANGRTLPLRPGERPERLLELRQLIKEGNRRVPQYWFGDYGGYMEEIARETGMERNNGPLEGDRAGPVTPSRYLQEGLDRMEASKAIFELKATLDGVAAGRFVARAAFRALHGRWRFRRELASKRPDMPSGLVLGEARFHPRFPTGDADAFDGEYLYVEKGTFKTEQGLTFAAARRYVWRYAEETETVSVWFVRTDEKPAAGKGVGDDGTGGRSAENLFHTLVFGDSRKAAPEEGTVHLASADHFCTPDQYTTSYRFEFEKVELRAWEVEHEVKGPQKDYVSRTRYERDGTVDW